MLLIHIHTQKVSHSYTIYYPLQSDNLFHYWLLLFNLSIFICQILNSSKINLTKSELVKIESIVGESRKKIMYSKLYREQYPNYRITQRFALQKLLQRLIYSGNIKIKFQETNALSNKYLN